MPFLTLSETQGTKSNPPFIHTYDSVASISPPASASRGCIPLVKLDVDLVTDAMAARLATSLLGHVLFLKNQVPFPIVQLSRIPGGQSSTRASKLRNELVASFDTLSSHLNTTFRSLSTSLALGASKTKPSGARTYLAILLGPSIGSAKARVMFAVDGLETKVWGVRPTTDENEKSYEEDEDEEEDGDDENEEDEEGENEAEDDEEGEECYACTSDDEVSASESDEDPPLSRSPSPVLQTILPRVPLPPRPLPSRPTYSYAEEQQALRNAERLLSRTLANAAAAEDENGNSQDHGMASEMAPTQTHVLLRAPRRFNHPAWIPRQNVSGSLDDYLQDFLEESEGIKKPDTKTKKRHGKLNKMEGIWISCRNESIPPDVFEEGQDGNEEDEMIWWSWDGKIVGFSDW